MTTEQSREVAPVPVKIVEGELGDLNVGAVDQGAAGAEPWLVSLDSPLEIVTTLIVATDEFTRPANTTAYASKDSVSNSENNPTILEFIGAGSANGGSGYITKARLISDKSDMVAAFRLHLYTTSVTPLNDNAAFTLLYANRAVRIGAIDFPNTQTEGAGSDAANSLNVFDRIPYTCASDDTKLYGMLEALTAFTPASAQKFFIELMFDRN